MLLFTHLLVGTIIGLVLATKFHDDWLILPCMAGAWLPDIVDKPLALALPFLDSGRTIGHSLLFLIVITTICLIMFKNRKEAVLGLSLSIFLHYLLDSMWKYQETWFFPLRGWFYVDPWVKLVDGRTFLFYYGESNTPLQWLQTLFSMEMTDPIEIVALILLVFILVGWTLDKSRQYNFPPLIKE